jgi:serine/threonine-protein kinase
MGDLYRAQDEVLDRPVAVKVLAERFASDEGVRTRFTREALAAARLSDEPNTVTIFDIGEWEGTPFIVMEYLGGGTLAQVLRGGPQPPGQVIGWLGQAARSLDAAHARGIVHRDVKPANLLLDDRGRIHVGDFGIATAAGLASLTMTGTVLGTVGYLAPEQAQGGPVGAAADCYALAVVAYELLTGRRPFARDSATAEVAAHLYEPVPSAGKLNPALPPSVDRVFERALAKDPAARFPSCAAFVAALQAACLQPAGTATVPIVPAPVPDPPTRVMRRPRPRSRSPVLAASAGLILLAGAGLAGAVLSGGGARTPAAVPPARTTTIIKTTTIAAAAATAKTPTTTEPPANTTAPPAAPPPGPAGASDLNTQGYELMLAGNFAAALPLLRRAVAGLLDPTNPVTAYANFNLGQTLVRLGDCSAALPFLERAQQLEPTRAEVAAAIVYAQQCAATQLGQPPDANPSAGAAFSGPGGGHHGHGNGNAFGFNGNGNGNDGGNGNGND